MAEIVWTEPAIADLEAIADYIALENSSAARELVQRVFAHVRQLQAHPESGTRPRELGSRTRYRQIVEPPCRTFYRFDGTHVYVVNIMRTERLLRRSVLRHQKPQT
ncbi:MAG: type II toxin-antitoxin system RelE/ParE family toxin [Xanthomonadales bacterium]|nr:type II toxin-antitoxin system RelE/ParE family toxin [Xanthomonadales bacterium]